MFPDCVSQRCGGVELSLKQTGAGNDEEVRGAKCNIRGHATRLTHLYASYIKAVYFHYYTRGKKLLDISSTLFVHVGEKRALLGAT